MRITALDHIVLNVADVERSLSFYSDKLGLPAERVDIWREGKVGFPSVRVNEHTIIDLVRQPPSGNNLAHFCLVADGEIEAVKEELVARGVTIDRDPGKRSGARGDGLSFYLHDPDGNEVEIRCY
ncbi:MAG TPA: VOC family protein [Chloroflexota bacterium]|nr:VOC family protein [Chloroflexota bacterium]